MAGSVGVGGRGRTAAIVAVPAIVAGVAGWWYATRTDPALAAAAARAGLSVADYRLVTGMRAHVDGGTPYTDGEDARAFALARRGTVAQRLAVLPLMRPAQVSVPQRGAAVEAARAALSDPDAHVRTAAAFAVMELGGSGWQETLKAELPGANGATRRQILMAIAKDSANR